MKKILIGVIFGILLLTLTSCRIYSKRANDTIFIKMGTSLIEKKDNGYYVNSSSNQYYKYMKNIALGDEGLHYYVLCDDMGFDKNKMMKILESSDSGAPEKAGVYIIGFSAEACKRDSFLYEGYDMYDSASNTYIFNGNSYKYEIELINLNNEKHYLILTDDINYSVEDIENIETNGFIIVDSF